MIERMDMACTRLKEINPNISITVPSIFLHKYDTPKNLRIVETNAAFESLSLSKRWDVINHYNIAFKRVNEWRMHLTLEEQVGVNILTSFKHNFVSDSRKFQCIASKKWLAMVSLLRL